MRPRRLGEREDLGHAGAQPPRCEVVRDEVNQPGSGDELRSPYVDEEDDLDYTHIMKCAEAVMEEQTGDPTSSS